MTREQTLAEKIEEHNRMGKEQTTQPAAPEVRSLMTGRFSGPDLKAIRVSPGDVVTVASYAYAESLVDAGLAEWLPEPESEPESEPETSAADEPKPKRGRSRKKAD